MKSSPVKTFLILFSISAVLRISAISIWQFDGLYGQDAFAYYENASLIYKVFPDFARILNEYWPVGKAAPIGYSAAIATVFLVLGISPFAGQLVSIVAGSLVAPLLYLLTTRLLKNESWEEHQAEFAGAVAGSLACFSGILVVSSITVMADALGLCLGISAVLVLLRYMATGRLLHAVLFPLLAGSMMLVRIPNVILGLVLGFYILFYSRNGHRIPAHHILISSAILVVLLSPHVAMVLQKQTATITESAVAGWTPVNFVKSSFQTSSGHQDNMLPNFLFYTSPFVYPAYLTPVIFPALLWGLITTVRKGSQGILILLLGWFLLFYVVLIGSPLQNMRYAEAFFPPLAILTAVGLSQMVLRWRSRQTLVRLWLLAGLLSMVGYDFFYLDKFVERKRQDTQAVQWVDSITSTETNIISFSITPSLRHYTKLNVSELYYQDTTSIRTLIRPGRTVIVADLSNLATQWRDSRILSLFEWIREHYAITELGRVHRYTGLLVQEPL